MPSCMMTMLVWNQWRICISSDEVIWPICWKDQSFQHMENHLSIASRYWFECLKFLHWICLLSGKCICQISGGKVCSGMKYKTFWVFYPRPVLAFGYCRCLRLSVCPSGRPIVVLEDRLYYWKSTVLLEDLLRCWKMNGRSKVLLENQLYWRQSTGLDGNYRSRKITTRRWLHEYVGAECDASSFTWYLYQMCNTDVRPSVCAVITCLSER